MSITDELREFIETHLYLGATALGGWKEAALAIVDRIDAEYDKTVCELNDLASSGISLPVDADGKLIRIGDMMECMLDGAKMVLPVGYMTYKTDGWHIALTIEESYKYQSYSPKELRHSNDTWEHIVEDAKRLGFTDPDNERLTSRLVARCKALSGDDK